MRARQTEHGPDLDREKENVLDGEAVLQRIALLGEEEIEARLAKAGLSGLSRHLKEALAVAE